jgi:glycosyltransferase involved in cell wall biosynthesis
MFFSSALENIAGYWRSFYLGKYLAMRGHEVYLFAQGRLPKFQKRIIDNVHLYLIPPFYEGYISYNTVPRIIFQSILNTLYSVISKIDVVHVFDHLFPPNFTPILILKIMRKKSKKPLIFIDWDDLWGGGILDTFHKNLNSFIRRSLAFTEKIIPLYGDAVTVTCETLRKRALDIGVPREKIFVIPNGTTIDFDIEVDVHNARKVVNLPENAVIYTCVKSSFDDVTPGNDPLWNLLLAHNEVTKIFKNAFLCFLGSGSEKCLAIAKKFNMNRNVITVGWQPLEKYLLHLVSSDLLIIPLSNTLFDNSRMPLRLLDYLAVGKPVIATDLLEIRALLKDYGLMFKSINSLDIANKIIEAIKNLEILKEKAKKAKEIIIKKYTWRNLAEELEMIYNNFLDCP